MNKSSSSINYGEVYRLGNHLLLCGDSRNKVMVAKLIDKLKIKAVIIDPPYGVAVTESKEGFQTLAKNKVVANDHLQSDGEYQKFSPMTGLKPITPHLERKELLLHLQCGQDGVRTP
jgi:16S rRNA G966 N2-methylase RsmD